VNTGASREAVVVQIEGAQASLRPADGCQGCGQAGACGLRADEASPLWQLRATEGLMAGQRVRIEAPPGLVLRAALAAYGLPLLAALLGAGLGARFGEGAALAGLVAGLACGVLALKACSQRWQRRGLMLPRLIPISIADAAAPDLAPASMLSVPPPGQVGSSFPCQEDRKQ